MSLAGQACGSRDERTSFAVGEPIHTEDSYKYTREHFARLTGRAGFSLEREWIDDKAYFCVQFLTVD